MPSPKPFLTSALLLLSLSPLMAGAEEKKPPLPAWAALAKDEAYEILVTFLPDSKGEKKAIRQIELNDKDCERNGNKSLEKEEGNSFITVECRADGNLLIRRSTLQPIGKLKQELTLTAVGTSRFEMLQGSDYYPDILLKVSRLKIVKPVATPAAPSAKPSVTPGATPGTSPSIKPSITPIAPAGATPGPAPGTAPVAPIGATPSAKPTAPPATPSPTPPSAKPVAKH